MTDSLKGPFTRPEIEAATQEAIADLRAKLTAATERAEKAEAERDQARGFLANATAALYARHARCCAAEARVAALEGALREMRDLFNATPALQGREHLDLGIRVNKLLDAALSAPPAPDVSQAASDVLAERRRQIEAEGWTPEHDGGQIAAAAACYALASTTANPNASLTVHLCWPWGRERFKLETPRRNLVKAAALILAEIERLDRDAAGDEREG